jgi:hypothetical protein
MPTGSVGATSTSICELRFGRNRIPATENLSIPEHEDLKDAENYPSDELSEAKAANIHRLSADAATWVLE